MAGPHRVGAYRGPGVMLSTMRLTRTTTVTVTTLACAALITGCSGGGTTTPTSTTPTRGTSTSSTPVAGKAPFAVQPVSAFSSSGTWGLVEATRNKYVADTSTVPVVDSKGRVWAIVHPFSGGNYTNLLVVDPATSTYAVSPQFTGTGVLGAPGGTVVFAKSEGGSFSATIPTATLGKGDQPGKVTMPPSVSVTASPATPAPVLRGGTDVHVATASNLYTFNPESRQWMTAKPTHGGRVIGVIPATSGGAQVEWVGAAKATDPTSVWVGDHKISGLNARAVNGQTNGSSTGSSGCFVTMLGATPAYAMLGESCYDALTGHFSQARIATVTPAGQTRIYAPTGATDFAAGAPNQYQFGMSIDPQIASAQGGTPVPFTGVVTTAGGVMVASSARTDQAGGSNGVTIVADQGGALHQVSAPQTPAAATSPIGALMYTAAMGSTVFGQAMGDNVSDSQVPAGVSVPVPAGPVKVSTTGQAPVATATITGRTYGVFYDPMGVSETNLVIATTT